MVKDLLHMLPVFVFQLREQRDNFVILSEPKVQYLETDTGADPMLVSDLSDLPASSHILNMAELLKVLFGFHVNFIVDVMRAHVPFALLVEPLSFLLVLGINDI